MRIRLLSLVLLSCALFAQTKKVIANLPADITVIATHALAVPGLDAARHLIVMQRRGTRA